jgi:protein-tyrosine phosphatase
MAEGFVPGLLRGRADVEVSSAGIVGWDGSPAVEEAIAAAAELGADISGHVARRLERAHVEASDLIVCMAAEHRDSVARMVPEAAARTFTLKELVMLLDEQPPGKNGGSLRERVGAADALRRSRAGSARRDDDVADPLGMTMDAFRTVAREIHEWSGRLVGGLFGSDVTDGRQAASA